MEHRARRHNGSAFNGFIGALLIALFAPSILVGSPQSKGDKPVFEREATVLGQIAGRVSKDGQKGFADKHVDAFLGLKGGPIVWHSQFDLERQIQLIRGAKAGSARLILLVPERPFPEFGKTWVYCVSLEGRLLRAGVAESREPFAPLSA